MSTRHSSTARSWSSTRGHHSRRPYGPARRERSASGLSPRLCTDPDAGGSLSTTRVRHRRARRRCVATAPAGTRRARPSHAVNATVATAGGSSDRDRRSTYRCATGRHQATGHQPLDERDGREDHAEPLGDELEVEQRSSSTTHARIGARRRTTRHPTRPRPTMNPSVSSDARTTAGGHSLAKDERLDELSLLDAQREVHCGPNLPSTPVSRRCLRPGIGVKVACSEFKERGRRS